MYCSRVPINPIVLSSLFGPCITSRCVYTYSRRIILHPVNVCVCVESLEFRFRFRALRGILFTSCADPSSQLLVMTDCTVRLQNGEDEAVAEPSGEGSGGLSSGSAGVREEVRLSLPLSSASGPQSASTADVEAEVKSTDGESSNPRSCSVQPLQPLTSALEESPAVGSVYLNSELSRSDAANWNPGFGSAAPISQPTNALQDIELVRPSFTGARYWSDSLLNLSVVYCSTNSL